jgi:hypothetical protein
MSHATNKHVFSRNVTYDSEFYVTLQQWSQGLRIGMQWVYQIGQ